MTPFPDVTLADVAAQAGINVEVISTLIGIAAPYLVSPLASVCKRWLKTTGPDTRAVIKILTVLIVVAGGYALGMYGYDWRGVLNAVYAGILAYLKTIGDYERDVNVQRKADRTATPAPAPRNTGTWPDASVPTKE